MTVPGDTCYRLCLDCQSGHSRLGLCCFLKYPAIKRVRFSTDIVKTSKTPKYNKTQVFPLTEALSDSSELTVKLFQAESVGKGHLLGTVAVKLGFLRGAGSETQFYKLTGSTSSSGRVRLRFKYTDPNRSAAAAKTEDVAAAAAPTDEESDVEAEKGTCEWRTRKRNPAQT